MIMSNIRDQYNSLKIYFAHAVKDYNTLYEEECLNKIREMYPDAIIINLKDIREFKSHSAHLIIKLNKEL